MIGSKLKILVLSDAASFHTERYMSELTKQNCVPHLLSLESGSGYESYTRLKSYGPIKQLHYIFAVKQIKDAVLKIKPDLISAHFASGYGFIAALANRKFDLPLIVNLWGSDILIVPGKSFLHFRKTKYALEKADCVIGDSKYLVDAAKEIASINYSMVVPWGIEKEHFSKHKSDYKLSAPLNIIVPRHHESVYNNLFIVESLAELIEDEKIKLTFPTFGSRYDLFKVQSEKIVGDKLFFYEKMERSDFLEFMSKHDVYLSASLSDSSPVSLIEAMALGLIPVAGEIDGIKEWLTSESGFMYKLNESQSLLNLIQKIINDNNNYEKMRLDNYGRVKRNAIFEDNISSQISIMRELVEKRCDAV